MWRLVRPDAVHALENPLVLKILPRYVRIVKDENIANFQICKKIPFELSRSMSDKELWKSHSELMRKFRKLKNRIDDRKIDFNSFKNPRYSLLDLKIILAENILKSCELCERNCNVNRLEGKLGECRVGKLCLISSDFTHLGEEPMISPSHTIFFMGCNFHCQYCQNWSISQWYEDGYPVTDTIIARKIEEKKKQGCRNVNFVGGDPTPNLYWILKSLRLCNVNQAVVWNSNFYMTKKTMKLLDGVVDLYLSDFKYGLNETAKLYSKVDNYWEIVTRNHLIASNQAELLIRILLLPGKWLETDYPKILKWVANNLKERVLCNIMSQYRPEFKANQYLEISRPLTREEIDFAIKQARKLKLNFIS